MADIQYWNDTLSEDIEQIQDLLNSVSSRGNDPLERSRVLEQTEQKLRSTEGTKRSFKMECRLVSDPVRRRGYEAQLAQFDQALKGLQSDLRAARAEGQRGELFLGAKKDPSHEPSADDGEAEGDALLKDAQNVQDKTQNSLDSIVRMTGEAKDVGMGTMEELKRQREQIKNIDQEAMKIEDNLVRADKLIRTFGRRIATDRMIQCFTCINVLLLVAVVIFAVFKKGGIPGTGGPPAPVRRMLRYEP